MHINRERGLSRLRSTNKPPLASLNALSPAEGLTHRLSTVRRNWQKHARGHKPCVQTLAWQMWCKPGTCEAIIFSISLDAANIHEPVWAQHSVISVARILFEHTDRGYESLSRLWGHGMTSSDHLGSMDCDLNGEMGLGRWPMARMIALVPSEATKHCGHEVELKRAKEANRRGMHPQYHQS